MKALIISFFCFILGYSYFFDKDDSNETSHEQQQIGPSAASVDKAEKPFYTDSMEYFARKRGVIYFNESGKQTF